MGIGKELKRLRKEVPISVAKISERIGVNAFHARRPDWERAFGDRWRMWERKDFNPGTEDTNLIEKFFGMPISKLIKLDSIKELINVPHISRPVIENQDPGKTIPAGNVAIPIGDYVELLKSQRDTYQRMLDGALANLQKQVEELRSEGRGRTATVLNEIRERNLMIINAMKHPGSVSVPKGSDKTASNPRKKIGIQDR